MSGILRLESLTKGNTLKQGDKTPLKYRLFDADGEKLNIAGKSAVVRLMYPDFLRVGYESESLTVSSDNIVTFSIDKVIQPVLYYLEITVDGKYIFPSRNDESKFNIDKSSQGSDAVVIEIIGKDVLVRDIKNMVDSEIEPVVNDMIVSNQKVIENEIIVKDVKILSEQLEARQNQVEQFNNQVITEMTDRDVISAPEILGARGGFDTLGARLDETTTQLDETTTYLAQTTNEIHLASFPRMIDELDDTERIKRALVATKDGDTLILRNEDEPYKISDTINVTHKKINFLCDNDVIYTGLRDRPTFVFSGQHDSDIEFKIISDGDTYPSYQAGFHGWVNSDYVGVMFVNSKNCAINIDEVRNFTTGVRCRADRGQGFWFNEVTIKSLQNNKYQLDLNQHGAGSWMNSNNFYGTSLTYSGPVFVNETQDRFGIIQTLTDGNQYKSNSNNFIRWKFESGQTFSGSTTWIYLRYASNWRFTDYRYEITKEMTFAVIDLEINLNQYNSLSDHTSGIEFRPTYTLGIGHEITFKNNENIKGSYSQVAKTSENDYLMAFEQSFKGRYRKYASNYHVIKDIFRKTLKSTSLTDEEVYDYNSGNLLLENGVNILGTFPIVLYLTNLKVGDEVTFEPIFSNGIPDSKPFYKAFDKSGNFIENGTISGARVLALEGIWDAPNFAFTNIQNRSEQRMTINHSDVGTVAILIYGRLNGFKLYSNNPSMIVKKTMNDFFEKNVDRVFVHSKPTLGVEGNFLPEDVVYNTNNNSGQIVGWKLSEGSWQSIGNY